MPAGRTRLFAAEVPDGFRYQDDFLTPDGEAALVEAIRHIEFSTFEMRGVVARRRVAFFGRTYGAGDAQTPPMPEFLVAVRDTVAAWAGLDADAFAMSLINEYPPGAPIGWHRDAPQYGVVAGISLLSACRMKFRPYVPPREQRGESGRRTATHEILLEPRSVYLMTGASRNAYEHHIPPVSTLRYSVTFRSTRSQASGP
jgi:hypothetical protein